MKANPEMLLIRFLVFCMCMSSLGTSMSAQTQGTYTQATFFTFRMEQLEQELRLTPVQLQQLKPIVEHETAELMQYACNPATSRRDKLTQFTEVFKRSESSMRPILREEQHYALVQLRKRMLEDYKNLKPPDSCTLAYWGRKTPYQK